MGSAARSTRTRAAAAGLLLVAGCSGCQSSTRSGIAIEKLRVAAESLAAAPELGMGESAFELDVQKAIERQGVHIGPADDKRHRFKARAEVEFARFGRLELADGGEGEAQTVGVLLELDPIEDEHAERVTAPASSFGATVLHPSLEARAASFQRALGEALDASAASLVRTATARELDTAALHDELTSPDGGVREAAADILVERKDRAAIPVLIAELANPDSEVALKAIGELVELKATEAVPRLIDMTTTHDPNQISDPHLQIQIVYALGSIGGDEAEAFLYTMASGHPLAEVRRAAREAASELRASAAKGSTGSSPASSHPSIPSHP